MRALALLCLSGCGAVVELELDGLERDHAALLVASEQGGALSVAVVGTADGQGVEQVALPRALGARERVRVEVLGYRRWAGPLGALAADPAGRAVPKADAVFERVVGEDPGAFVEAAAPSAALLAFRSAALPAEESRCVRFEARILAVPSVEPVSAVVALGAGRALVFTGRYTHFSVAPAPRTELFEVEGEALRPRALPAALAPYRVDLARFDGGELVLATSAWGAGEVRVFAGTLEGGLREWPRPPTDAPIGALERDGAGWLAVTMRGAVLAYDGAWTTVIDERLESPSGCLGLTNPDAPLLDHVTPCPRLHRYGGGWILHAPNGRTLRRLEGPVLVDVPGGTDALKAASGVTPLGIVAIAAQRTESSFYVYEGAELRPLALAVPTLAANAIASFRDGFLYAGSFGYAGQYAPGLGFCPTNDGLAAGLRTTSLVALGGERFLMSGWAQAGHNSVAVIWPKE